MRDYTVRFFLEDQTIVEYRIKAVSATGARIEARMKFHWSYGSGEAEKIRTTTVEES